MKVKMVRNHFYCYGNNRLSRDSRLRDI